MLGKLTNMVLKGQLLNQMWQQKMFCSPLLSVYRFPFLDALAIFVFDVADMRVLLTHQCSPILLSVCIGYK
jgi:hypothetical protein